MDGVLDKILWVFIGTLVPSPCTSLSMLVTLILPKWLGEGVCCTGRKIVACDKSVDNCPLGQVDICHPGVSQVSTGLWTAGVDSGWSTLGSGGGGCLTVGSCSCCCWPSSWTPGSGGGTCWSPVPWTSCSCRKGWANGFWRGCCRCPAPGTGWSGKGGRLMPSPDIRVSGGRPEWPPTPGVGIRGSGSEDGR